MAQHRDMTNGSDKPCEQVLSGTTTGALDGWRLLLASFLSLYVELILIRWIPSNLHIIGFFSNLVLIACFLGLGTRHGAAARSRTGGLAGLVPGHDPGGSAPVARPDQHDSTVTAEGDYAGQRDRRDTCSVRMPVWLLVLAVFVAVVWTMIPFGRLVATYFDGIERVRAYSINVAGSLLGVLAFSLLAWLELPPLVWFAGGLTLALALGPAEETRATRLCSSSPWSWVNTCMIPRSCKNWCTGPSTTRWSSNPSETVLADWTPASWPR